MRLPRKEFFSLSAVILLLAITLAQAPSASGGYIEEYKMAIGDRWNYAVEYWNHTFYVDLEVIDEGVISSFNQVREVYVLNADYYFGDIKTTETLGLTYEVDFHQKYYLQKDTLETIRIESFLNAKITIGLAIIGGHISIYLKQLDDMNYLTGGGFPIEDSGNVIQNIDQQTFRDIREYGDYAEFGGFNEDEYQAQESEVIESSYKNYLFYTGQLDVTAPPGNFQTQGMRTSYGQGMPYYYYYLKFILDILIMFNWALDHMTDFIAGNDVNDTPYYEDYDYSSYNRTEHYSTQTRLPVIMADRLGEKTLWTWELQDYYLAEEDLPYLTLRSYYYFIAFGVVALIVFLVVIYNVATLKPSNGKEKARRSKGEKSIEDLQMRLESVLDKKGGVAALAPQRRKPKVEPDDVPEYSMQRDLYGSRSYGQRPGPDRSYSISPREQRDLYDHFGQTEDSRNIFDEDYPAPPSPEERLRDRLRR